MMTSETERLRDFWAFICERHEIFIRRHIEKRPWPWTDDRFLQRGRFTNVYRELDRVTRWLTLNVMNGPLSAEDRAFNVVVYRRFCVPETFVAIGGPCPRTSYDWPVVRRVLRERQERGLRLFTGAFFLTNGGQAIPKRDLVCRHLGIAARDWPARWDNMLAAPTLQQAHADLVPLPGLGGFMAYEILIDLCEARLLPFSLNDWVYVGPGARRGAELLAGRPLPGAHADAFVAALTESQDEQLAAAGVTLRGPRLTLENVENCLCEFSKLVKLRASGRIKRRYAPPALIEQDDLWRDLPEKFQRETKS